MDEYEESETVDCDDWPDWIGYAHDADGDADDAEPEQLDATLEDGAYEEYLAPHEDGYGY